MLKATALAALVTVGGTSALCAQTDYYVRLGATGASNLLHDQITLGTGIDTKMGISPTLVAGAAMPFQPRYQVGIEATLATGNSKREEAGVTTRIGTLRTASFLLNLDGPITGPLRWRAGGGTLTYLPSEKIGIFAQGGGTRLLVGGGLDYRKRALGRWDLMASARYDYHRFTTDQLKARGFAQSQQVSRVSLTVGIARGTR